jgi:phosphatidate cytidylyltransferase
MSPRVVRRIATGASLALGAAALLVADRWLPAGAMPWGVATILCGLCVWELQRMGGLRPLRLTPPLGVATLLVSASAFLVTLGLLDRPEWLTGARALGLGYLGAGLVALEIASLVRGPLRKPGLVVVLALWCVPPLFGLGFVQEAQGTAGLVALIVLAKIGDIFGWFVGRSIGQRHPFPRLSPGKTVAGCVASAVAGTVAGLLIGAFGLLDPGAWGLPGAALAGLLVNLVAQAGDLAESAVKRFSGVKDSSTLAGAAGGVLDVVDSLLLATPVALVAFPVLFA